MLLQNGADVNAVNDCKETPLHFANDPKFATELLNHGANIDAQDEKGKTALYIAERRGNSEVFEVLVKRGANVHLRRNHGASTLENVLEVGSNSFEKPMAKYSEIDITKSPRHKDLYIEMKAKYLNHEL